jgi:hypothetical protein
MRMRIVIIKAMDSSSFEHRAERLTLVIIDSAPTMELANAHAIMGRLATCLQHLSHAHLCVLGRALFEFAVSESTRHS